MVIAPVINGARYWAIIQEHINLLFYSRLSYPLRRRTKESMKANRKSSKKESNIPIVESPEVKHAPLGADEFGTPILPTLTHTVAARPGNGAFRTRKRCDSAIGSEDLRCGGRSFGTRRNLSGFGTRRSKACVPPCVVFGEPEKRFWSRVRQTR